MFGFGAKKKDEGKELREKQFRDLRALHPLIRRPNNDDTLYELLFQANSQMSTLRIYIPADFPLAKPVLQITGPLVHPWLDQYKRVTGCELLNHWMRTTNLSDVVQASIAAFQTGGSTTVQSVAAGSVYQVAPSPQPRPPQYPAQQPQQYAPQISPFQPQYPAPYLPQQPALAYPQSQYPQAAVPFPNRGPYSAPAPQLPPPPVYSDIAFKQPQQLQQPQQPTTAGAGAGAASVAASTSISEKPLPQPDTMPMPDIPSSFPDLRTLTEPQLEALLADQNALKLRIQAMPAVDMMRTGREDKRTANERRAERTLEMEATVTTLHTEVLSLQAMLKKRTGEYRLQLQAVTQKQKQERRCLPPEDVRTELRKRKDDLEARAEDTATRFVDGQMDLTPFLQEYLEARREFHLLEEKLKCSR